jgi:branched-chain amino acid transport system permease protein
VGLGFTIIHRVTGIINFAQGEFVMLGGMVAFFMLSDVGLPLWLACLVAVVIVTIVGLLLQRLAIRPAKNASVVTLIIITIGASIFLRGLAGQFFGKESVPLPPFSGEQAILVGGAAIQPQSLWVIGSTIVFMLLFQALLNWTPLGKALSAVAISKRAAGIVGINVHTMSLISFGVAAALGAIGGLMIAPIALTSYESGVMLGLKGFIAAAMGGLSSPFGAVAGGFGLGILESLGAAYISSAYKDAIALLIFFIILLVRAKQLSRSEVES